jgi:hypothetical protein
LWWYACHFLLSRRRKYWILVDFKRKLKRSSGTVPAWGRDHVSFRFPFRFCRL